MRGTMDNSFSYDTVRGCTSQLSKGCKGCVIGGSVTMMRETCGHPRFLFLRTNERGAEDSSISTRCEEP